MIGCAAHMLMWITVPGDASHDFLHYDGHEATSSCRSLDSELRMLIPSWEMIATE